MPLSPATITSALQTVGPEFRGPSFAQLSLAIGAAVHQWAVLPVNLSLSGLVTGLSGAGIVTGVVTVPPNVPSTLAIFSSNGLNGPNGVSLARTIGVGIPLAFSSAAYTGGSIGVSTGLDVSKVAIANAITLLPLLISNFTAFAVGGPTAIQVANAVSQSVSVLLLQGVGAGTVSPTVIGFNPSAGTSPFSNVF
jgi:hypothetical protein